MTTKSMTAIRSSSEIAKPNCRCSICGKILRAPQEILTMGNKQYCDACYHDSFFANDRSSHRLALDCYDK